MNPEVPFYIPGLIVIIVAILLYAIYYALNHAFTKLEYSEKKKSGIIVTVFIGIFTWLVISAVIAFKGTLLDFTSVPPKLMLIILPSVIGVTYISISSRVNKLLEVIPSAWLVYIQSYRILVELALWLLFINKIIPLQMTFEGLNYDILTGLGALLIGYYSLTVNKWPRLTAVLWNFAGLLLVTNIFIIALLSTPSPLRQFFNEPANTIVAYFPFVWIPAFIVPFAYIMHILSLKQLIRNYN